MDSNMEEEESLERIVEDAILTQATCFSLASLDLQDIPATIFTQLQSKLSVRILKLAYNDLVTLPHEIGLLTSLEEIHLTGNKLDYLPDTVGQLTHLKLMNLNENNLEKLPETITKLQNLQILNVVGNQLEIWPEELGLGLTGLTELRADENLLQNLPENFACLSKLRVLELSDNKLSKLPAKFGDLQDLRILNLSQNNIKELPESFSELMCLTSLDITENHMEFLPDKFKSAEKLQYFYAVNNLFRTLPCWFEKLFSIIELNLSNNELTDMALPEVFGMVSGKTLVALDLSGNKMTALPDSIGELHKLETLHLGSTICELERRAFQNGNWLPRLPETFGQLSAITTLHLDENQIVCLPESFGNLSCLEWVDVSQNRITKLPKSFCALTNLWFLQFSKNHLESLPEDFGNLSSLVELKLDSNKLTTLPESFSKLQNLELVDLFCNCLTEIPKVLQKLKKLQRLDLDGNNLKIKEDKVPKLTTNVQYAPRNPDADNWRSKVREDKKEHYFECDQDSNQSITHLIENAELEEQCDNSDYTEEYMYNERALERAMMRGLSIWRSHTGSQTRQETHLQREKSFKFVPHEEDMVHEVFEDAIDHNDIDNHELQQSSQTLVTDDWDKEADVILQQRFDTIKGLKRTQPSMSIREQLQDILYSYPPAQQAYTKSAMYDSIYRATVPVTTKVSCIIDHETGQFDDADHC